MADSREATTSFPVKRKYDDSGHFEISNQLESKSDTETESERKRKKPLVDPDGGKPPLSPMRGVRGGDVIKSVSEDQEESRQQNCQLAHKAEGAGEDDGDDSSSCSSDLSDLSGVSGISTDIASWRPDAGPMSWVHRQMLEGRDPRVILGHLVPQVDDLLEEMDDFQMWKMIIQILSEPPQRDKLQHINTLDDVIRLLHSCSNIIVLTGAGVSVSCGIPDFRSRDGIYARLAVEYPDLPDPQAMFDIQYFINNQKPFFKFAKEIYPGEFRPSPSHQFIKLLEDHGKLLRNYTQNIDTLEEVAGIKNVIHCHGSFATATCMSCRHKMEAEDIKEDIMNQVIPKCPKCAPDEDMAIMKPDIVFFGESLPPEFHDKMDQDKDRCDLLIVIGSSLKVRPVALIPNSLPSDIPQILINRETLKHLNFDVELLGDCDVIVNELCHKLGESWQTGCTSSQAATEISRDELPTPPMSPLPQTTPEQSITSISGQLSAGFTAPSQPTVSPENISVSMQHTLQQTSQHHSSSAAAVEASQPVPGTSGCVSLEQQRQDWTQSQKMLTGPDIYSNGQCKTVSSTTAAQGTADSVAAGQEQSVHHSSQTTNPRSQAALQRDSVTHPVTDTPNGEKLNSTVVPGSDDAVAGRSWARTTMVSSSSSYTAGDGVSGCTRDKTGLCRVNGVTSTSDMLADPASSVHMGHDVHSPETAHAAADRVHMGHDAAHQGGHHTADKEAHGPETAHTAADRVHTCHDAAQQGGHHTADKGAHSPETAHTAADSATYHTNSPENTSGKQLSFQTDAQVTPRFNLATALPDGKYLFLPPNRYVFKGAEVYESLEKDRADTPVPHDMEMVCMFNPDDMMHSSQRSPGHSSEVTLDTQGHSNEPESHMGTNMGKSTLCNNSISSDSTIANEWNSLHSYPCPTHRHNQKVSSCVFSGSTDQAESEVSGSLPHQGQQKDSVENDGIITAGQDSHVNTSRSPVSTSKQSPEDNSKVQTGCTFQAP